MSGVTGVLLSYGSSGYVPPWVPDFTMTNVDNILLTVDNVITSNDWFLFGEMAFQGNVGTPPPSGEVGSFVGDYIEPITNPELNTDHEYYDAIDYGSAGYLWTEAVEQSPYFSYKFNGTIMFSNLVTAYPAQTIFTGYIKPFRYFAIPSPSGYSLTITPYAGGVAQRQYYTESYGGSPLEIVNGVSGAPVTVAGDYYTYDIDEAFYFLVYTRVNYIYHVPTKTLYLQVETVVENL